MRLVQRITNLFLSLGLFLGIIGTLTGTTNAAGAAAISVEGVSSVMAGEQFNISLYVTPSGGTIYSGEVNVSLSGATFVSYNTSSSPFTGLNAVMSGNSAGSTSFTVAFSYIGAVPGASSKVLIGTAKLQAASSAGTAQVSLSGQKADDGNGDAMSPVTIQNKSLTINAAPTPTCPSGQIGTYPDCKSPQSSGGGNSNNPPANNNTSNPVISPNPESTANIPGSNNEPETVTEDTLSQLATDTPLKTTEKTEEVKTSDTKRLILIIGAGGVISLALIGIAARIILAKMAAARELRRHLAGAQSNPVVNGEPQVSTNVSTDKGSDSPITGNEPTIIKPELTDGEE